MDGDVRSRSRIGMDGWMDTDLSAFIAKACFS